MPTKEQMDAVLQQLERREAQYEGLSLAGLANANSDIDWEGFTESQRRGVELRIYDGDSPDMWMDGIELENDRLTSSSPPSPLEDVEKEVRRIKETPNHEVVVGTSGSMVRIAHIGGWGDWAEPQRLHFLEGLVKWDGIDAGDKRRILEREVDFSQVATEDQQEILGEIWRRSDAKPFELKPGPDSGPEKERSVRPLTEELIAAAMLDVWPGIATVVDFGIDSERHLGALQFAIREQLVTPQELDAAMGSGAKLTEIAQRGENPYRDVTFKTSWDGLPLEPPNEAGEHDTKTLFAEWTADYAAAKERDSGKAEFNRILTEQPERQESRQREPEERER